jgi:hypothetical protein
VKVTLESDAAAENGPTEIMSKNTMNNADNILSALPAAGFMSLSPYP